jgi:hypothetical protein
MRLANYLIRLDVPDHTAEEQLDRILEALDGINFAERVQRYVNKQLLESNRVLCMSAVEATVVD